MVNYYIGLIHHKKGQLEQAEERLKDAIKCLKGTTCVPDCKAWALWYLAIVYSDFNNSRIREIPVEIIRELVIEAKGIFEKLDIQFDNSLAEKIVSMRINSGPNKMTFCDQNCLQFKNGESY
ncbi:MAG: hypothetical protein TUN42_09555 [Dehalogenimonas sp.]